jgi:hypothetical protein
VTRNEDSSPVLGRDLLEIKGIRDAHVERFQITSRMSLLTS